MIHARNTFALRAALMASCAALTVGSAAQAQQTADKKPESETVEAVVVTGFRQAYANAIATKRETLEISDGISSDGLGRFPDLNVGEAIQRIPGIQINREADSRNATISLRGLPGVRPHHAERRRVRRSDPERLDPAGRLQLGHLQRHQRHQVAVGVEPGRRPVGQYRPAHQPGAGPQGRRLRQAVLRVQRAGQPGQPAGLAGLQQAPDRRLRRVRRRRVEGREVPPRLDHGELLGQQAGLDPGRQPGRPRRQPGL
jgi:hypothetical protein